MSYGQVFIYPAAMFDVVEGLERRAAHIEPAPDADLDVADAAAEGDLGLLLARLHEARSALSDNLVLAARALMLATTRVIDADVVEQNVEHWRALAGPDQTHAPTADDTLPADVSEFTDDVDASTDGEDG